MKEDKEVMVGQLWQCASNQTSELWLVTSFVYGKACLRDQANGHECLRTPYELREHWRLYADVQGETEQSTIQVAVGQTFRRDEMQFTVERLQDHTAFGHVLGHGELVGATQIECADLVGWRLISTVPEVCAVYTSIDKYEAESLRCQEVAEWARLALGNADVTVQTSYNAGSVDLAVFSRGGGEVKVIAFLRVQPEAGQQFVHDELCGARKRLAAIAEILPRKPDLPETEPSGIGFYGVAAQGSNPLTGHPRGAPGQKGVSVTRVANYVRLAQRWLRLADRMEGDVVGILPDTVVLRMQDRTLATVRGRPYDGPRVAWEFLGGEDASPSPQEAMDEALQTARALFCPEGVTRKQWEVVLAGERSRVPQGINVDAKFVLACYQGAALVLSDYLRSLKERDS